MKKIKYPKNWKETYWNIFTDSQKKELKNQWIKLHNKYNFLLYFSNNIKDIITGDFEIVSNLVRNFIPEKSLKSIMQR